MADVSPLARMLRALLAVAVACSWLLLTGLPATAAITDSRVESPQPQAVLSASQPLVVAVWRTPKEDPDGTVCTQLFLGSAPTPEDQPSPTEEPSVDPKCEVRKDGGQPVGTVLNLQVLDRTPTDSGEIVRFGGVIDPYNLAWLGGAVAENGQYTVRYTAVGQFNSHEGSVGFILDAPPPAQPAPTATLVGKAKNKRIEVAWEANAAPDRTGYTVERRRGDGAWRSVTDVAADVTQITDTVDKYGSYQYRVTAARPTWDAKGTHATTSEASGSVTLQPPPKPPPPPPDPAEDDAIQRPTESGTRGEGSNDTPPPSSSSGGYPTLSAGPVSAGSVPRPDTGSQDPVVAMPRGYDDTYKGPLKYNVQQEEVTERVPIDIAQGGVTEEGGTLTMLDRAVDRERVLPPVAGGLILVLSAAHVLRYLNE